MKAPVCVKCRVVMRIKKTGADVEMMFGGEDSAKGYQIWSADIFSCQTCGSEVLSGFGPKPVADHYDRARYARFEVGVSVRFWDSPEDVRP